MAQTGYTPILIYSSSTGSNVPAAGNLTNSTLGSELAINITDGKLFYKDNNNIVQVIAWKTTPTTAGGTGLTTYVAGDLLYYASGTALTRLSIGAANTVLTSSGTAPQWSTNLNIGSLTATSINDSGNLTFTGTAARIIADFSNAGTATNRAAFQDSTTNSSTQVNAISNGTGTETAFVAYAGSTISNVSRLRVGATSSAGVAFIESSRVGSGTFLPLTFSTNNAEQARIDTSGNFLVGTTSAESGYRLNVLGNAFVTPPSGQTVAKITADSGDNRLILASYFEAGVGQYSYISSTNNAETGNVDLFLRTGTTDRVRIASGGDVTVSTGNLVIGTSGKGIDFSATAGTGTSELLADYEEGTWTPTIASNTGTITSYTSSGSYTKVGRQVTLIFTFKITNNGTGAGFIKITNLPFNVVTGNSAGTGVEFAAVGYQTVAYVGSSTQINMFKYDWTYPGGLNHEFYVTITYQN